MPKVGFFKRDVLLAFASFYLPHVIFLFYKIGQSLFSPATKLYLYDSVCLDRCQKNQQCVSGNLTTDDDVDDANTSLLVDCQNLSTSAEDLVQGIATDYIMAMKILQDVPAFFVGMYCGGWIDRVGRRLPMMISCLGGAVVAILFASIQAAGAMAIPGIFVGLAVNSMTGRNTLVTTAIQAYVADRTLESERTKQLGFLLAMNFFGLFIGSFLMALMADKLPFWSMFLCVSIVYLFAFLLVLFALREQKSISNNDRSSESVPSSLPVPPAIIIKNLGQIIISTEEDLQHRDEAVRLQTSALSKKMASFFRIANLTDTIRTIVRKRPNNQRCYLLLTYLCIILQNMCKSGEVDVLLLFVKHSPLSWSKSYYGYLLSFQYAIVGLLLVIVLPFLLSQLHFDDTSVIMACSVAKVLGLSILAFSDRSWMIFVANVFIATFGMIISCLRSLVSKMVSEEENGRCFAVISSSETLSDLIGTVLFTRLYHVGLSLGNLGRSLPFLVIAIVHLIVIALIISIRYGMNQQRIRTNNNSSSSRSHDDADDNVSSAPTETAAASGGVRMTRSKPDTIEVTLTAPSSSSSSSLP